MGSLYRQCVGIVVYNNKKVLLCERRDTKGAWQFPQGGIEQGEDLETAARRELKEETSIISVTAKDFIKVPLIYDFPPEIKKGKWKYIGQEMRWVLFQFNGIENEINISTSIPEFSRYMWADIEEAGKKIVEFKKEVYAKVIEKFKPIVEK